MAAEFVLAIRIADVNARNFMTNNSIINKDQIDRIYRSTSVSFSCLDSMIDNK